MATVKNSLIPVSVSISDIKAHILLMKAICKLQESVQGGPIPSDPEDGAVQPSKVTLCFIQRAMERFATWINSVNMSHSSVHDNPITIPPLDVLMIWHSYMLAPAIYYADSSETIPALAQLGGMPWNELVACIDEKTGQYVPMQEQVQHWEKTTSLKFNPALEGEESPDLSALPTFRVDLVNAVLRQSQSHIRMLMEAKCHENENDDLWLKNAIDRYTRFMSLPDGNYVPPIDVDIVWHTHQLSGTNYWKECSERFGAVIDHNDSIPIDAVRDGQRRMQEVSHLLGGDLDTIDRGIPGCGGPACGCWKHHHHNNSEPCGGPLCGCKKSSKN